MHLIFYSSHPVVSMLLSNECGWKQENMHYASVQTCIAICFYRLSMWHTNALFVPASQLAFSTEKLKVEINN
jgi:hypothetical protein